MERQPTDKILKDSILTPIEDGKVKMRPRWYFFVLATLYLVGVILWILFLLYLVSFIIFILDQNSIWFLPGFGFRGIHEFLTSLPWILIFLAIPLIIILEILVKRYSFVYRRPLIYSIIGIVAFSMIGGFVVAMTPFHNGLLGQAEKKRLPFAGGLYRYYGIPNKRNLVIGNITKITNNEYHIKGTRGEITNILVKPQMHFSSGMNFVVGDKIIVFGKFEGDAIEAFGIKKINNHNQPPFPMQDSR